MTERLKRIRKFETGATRGTLNNKLQYEGFLSPLVLKHYAEYLHKHRVQADGALREPDNWQKGIPKETYADSLLRHVMDVWLHHKGFGKEATESLNDALCGVMFNAMGYLFEMLRKEYVNEPKRKA